MNAALTMIGADPECFVANSSGIHHCIDMLGGSKEYPRRVRGGAVQEDNVLFEFNVDPTHNAEEFLNAIRMVMERGSDILEEFDLNLVPGVSSHIFKSLKGFPDKAFEFGCTPDYNAMTGEANPSPSAENEMLRTAGGHVHIGWDHLCTVTKELQESVGMMCDYYLGLPSLLEDHDTLRRELYGKAGAIRYKPYGVEYRTLSNYWIWDDAMVKVIHGRAQRAFANVANLAALQELIPQAAVQHCINTGDVNTAKAYLEIIENAGL